MMRHARARPWQISGLPPATSGTRLGSGADWPSASRSWKLPPSSGGLWFGRTIRCIGNPDLRDMSRTCRFKGLYSLAYLLRALTLLGCVVCANFVGRFGLCIQRNVDGRPRPGQTPYAQNFATSGRRKTAKTGVSGQHVLGTHCFAFAIQDMDTPKNIATNLENVSRLLSVVYSRYREPPACIHILLENTCSSNKNQLMK